jgi:hypothetical protein
MGIFVFFLYRNYKINMVDEHSLTSAPMVNTFYFVYSDCYQVSDKNLQWIPEWNYIILNMGESDGILEIENIQWIPEWNYIISNVADRTLEISVSNCYGVVIVHTGKQSWSLTVYSVVWNIYYSFALVLEGLKMLYSLSHLPFYFAPRSVFWIKSEKQNILLTYIIVACKEKFVFSIILISIVTLCNWPIND